MQHQVFFSRASAQTATFKRPFLEKKKEKSHFNWKKKKSLMPRKGGEGKRGAMNGSREGRQTGEKSAYQKACLLYPIPSPHCYTTEHRLSIDRFSDGPNRQSLDKYWGFVIWKCSFGYVLNQTFLHFLSHENVDRNLEEHKNRRWILWTVLSGIYAFVCVNNRATIHRIGHIYQVGTVY